MCYHGTEIEFFRLSSDEYYFRHCTCTDTQEVVHEKAVLLRSHATCYRKFQLARADYHPEAIDEEPQLIFHKSATERFNGRLSYGGVPKVALISRLLVPSV